MRILDLNVYTHCTICIVHVCMYVGYGDRKRLQKELKGGNKRGQQDVCAMKSERGRDSLTRNGEGT